MPQAQLPIFPHGTTEINANLAFERQADLVVYYQGLLPVFQHHVKDTKTFHLIVSQFYVNDNATQAEMCRAFGVTPISLKRAVKCYREKGAAGFFEEPARRGAVVLTAPVLAKAQQQLDAGSEVAEVAAALAIKADTLRKAVAAGKLHCPGKKKRRHARQTS
jgi:transposase-like protein